MVKPLAPSPQFSPIIYYYYIDDFVNYDIFNTMNIEKYYLTDNKNYNYFESLSPSQFEEEKRRIQLILKLAHLNGNKSLIDIGTGPGWLPREARKYTKNVLAVDVSDYQINLSEKYIGKSNFKFREGSIYNIPARKNSFDIAVTSEVIEHLEKPEKGIVEVYRILKSNGKLIITVPYREKIHYTICMHCLKQTSVNGHLHIFDRKNISAILRNSGFTIETIKLFESKITSVLGLNQYLKILPISWWLSVDKLFGKPQKMLIIAKKP
jgi:ubiquinone/menaquinone biosynthesis C-methylase UbiE